MNDPLVLWTALGVLFAVFAQLGQFMHISSKMERRFTILEIELKHLQRTLDTLQKRHVDKHDD